MQNHISKDSYAHAYISLLRQLFAECQDPVIIFLDIDTLITNAYYSLLPSIVWSQKLSIGYSFNFFVNILNAFHGCFCFGFLFLFLVILVFFVSFWFCLTGEHFEKHESGVINGWPWINMLEID